jgi:ADP-ribosyl-[dinitrogen reductase] hydrolase
MTMSTDYHHELETALRAARTAGDMLRADFYREEGARGSGGFAEVDRKAEQEIRTILLEAHPGWGYRGEETEGKENEAGDGHVWLVDPNDGTSAYVQGYRGSAVSIALLQGGSLVLGVVYAPLAPDGRGDLFAWAKGCGPIRRNGIEMGRLSFPEKPGAHDIVFVSHKADTRSEANAQLVQPGRFRAVPGIAYRLALIAAGEGVAAVSLSSPGDYDYAGGHALLQAAGGSFVNDDGLPISYSPRGESHTHWCFAGAPALVEELRKKDWSPALRRVVPEKRDYDLVAPLKTKKVQDPGVLERGQGCLLGQLAGDALGSLVEFLDPATSAKKYPHGVRELLDGGTFNTIAGQPTDDSEMALMLARSIIRAGIYSAEEAARAYVFWYKSAPFDVGGTTSQALSAIAYSSEESALDTAARAASRESQSNGSLMRISPIGIWGYALQPREIAEYARIDSSLTHPHQVCQDACAALAVAIARGISMGKGAEDVYRHTLDFAEKSACPEIVQTLRDAAKSPPSEFRVQMGWVRIALHNAFYQMLHAVCLEEGVVDTVMRGGDTDTNAAIAGSLLGAVHGRREIPGQWQQMILTCRPIKGLVTVSRPRPRAFWPVDALEIAEQLLGLS